MDIKFNNFLPIFFIIVFILAIYFILFKKNKEYYENQIFSNFSNYTQKEYFQNKSLKEMAGGYWTYLNTTVDGDQLNGMLLKVVLNSEDPLDGYIIFVLAKDVTKEIGRKIPITSIVNNKIIIETTLTRNNEKNIMEIDCNDQGDNPLKSENIPMAMVKTSDGFIKRFKIFKMNNPKIIGGKLSRIIASMHYYDLPLEEKYDLNTYNKYLSYQYPSEPFRVEYGGVDVKEYLNNPFYKKLNNIYENEIYFCYQREYATVDNEVVRTPLSPKYNLSLVKNPNYFSKIILTSIEEENRVNNILKPFVIKNTYIYIYKKIKRELVFINDKNYLSQKFYSTKDLNFKNNFKRSLLNKPIDLLQIEDIEAEEVSNMNLTLLNKYVMTSNDIEITILPSDLEKII